LPIRRVDLARDRDGPRQPHDQLKGGGDDAKHHDIGAREIRGVVDHLAEPGIGGDHFGRDRRRPTDARKKVLHSLSQ
jgi:hypothetical protein